MTQAQDQFSGASGSWSRPLARNHAERVHQYQGIAPRASAGVVTQRQQVWANGAVAAGHDTKTGLTVELMTASFGTGDQTELEAAFVRVGAQAPKLTVADRNSSIALTGQLRLSSSPESFSRVGTMPTVAVGLTLPPARSAWCQRLWKLARLVGYWREVRQWGEVSVPAVSLASAFEIGITTVSQKCAPEPA